MLGLLPHSLCAHNVQKSLQLLPLTRLQLSSPGQMSVVGRPGYLGEGVRAAPSPQEQLHTVGVDPFNSRVQGSQTFLEDMGAV